ncbi:MAG: thiamine phosphate synthase [Alphaproteobacteria bacterium GM202ARS2]|nr:thiamine phosphate synthase [Alphaproteobacteria bacterium GM202ARS2]
MRPSPIKHHKKQWWLLTDDTRTPDPIHDIHVPAGVTSMPSMPPILLYRHYNHPHRLRHARTWQRAHRCRYPLSFAWLPSTRAPLTTSALHIPAPLLATPALSKWGLYLRYRPRLSCSTSAHTPRQFWRAHKTAAIDSIILAPLFPTQSPASRPLFPYFLALRLAHTSTKPIIALGGINATTSRRLRHHPFAGMGAVDAFRKKNHTEA